MLRTVGEEEHAHTLLSPAFWRRQRPTRIELRAEELGRSERIDAAEPINVGADAAPLVHRGEGNVRCRRVLITRTVLDNGFTRLRRCRGATGEDPQHRT